MIQVVDTVLEVFKNLVSPVDQEDTMETDEETSNLGVDIALKERFAELIYHTLMFDREWFLAYFEVHLLRISLIFLIVSLLLSVNIVLVTFYIHSLPFLSHFLILSFSLYFISPWLYHLQELQIEV